jgi:glycosyltransferase involved in cell wall biosynthesis
MVLASSSRLFTAFLGKRCAATKKCPLYLDVRDIFTDVMKDIFKNRKMIQVPSGWLLNAIEWYTFRNATHINLISGGFKDYFKKYPRPTYSYYSNGIDEEFVEAGKKESVDKGKPYIITYAGNIGSGQGMEKIIPEAALKLGSDYIFRIIGDGGTRKLLEARLKELHVDNVEMLNPMARKDLIRYYQEATFLFVHLNDLEAFTKVLPSKIFEFGAFDKPIIAGVSGYAAEFVKDNVTNSILFKPTDVDGFVGLMKNYQLKFERRADFIRKFARKEIDKRLAESIVGVLKGGAA